MEKLLVSLVFAGAILAILFAGCGILAYIVAALVMPNKPE